MPNNLSYGFKVRTRSSSSKIKSIVLRLCQLQNMWEGSMICVGMFAFVKLGLLFYYRRMFIVHQKWLRIAWWVNLVYVVAWFFGAIMYFGLQCSPATWFWMRFYDIYRVSPPYPIEGQCNSSSPQHAAMVFGFGILQDVMILALPISTIVGLQLSRKRKIGFGMLFSSGAL